MHVWLSVVAMYLIAAMTETQWLGMYRQSETCGTAFNFEQGQQNRVGT